MNRPLMSGIDKIVVRMVYARTRRFVGRPIALALQTLGIVVPRPVQIGRDLVLPHATAGLVLHRRTTIGDCVSIFHNVTIGRSDGASPSREEIPGCVIEDRAVVCAGAVILPGPNEPLVIGRGAIVAANAVVTRSIPAGETWGGVPARRLA